MEAEGAAGGARAAEQRMADGEAQYAPLAEHAGALQRQLVHARAAAEAAAADTARLAAELDHYRCRTCVRVCCATRVDDSPRHVDQELACVQGLVKF